MGGGCRAGVYRYGPGLRSVTAHRVFYSTRFCTATSALQGVQGKRHAYGMPHAWSVRMQLHVLHMRTCPHVTRPHARPIAGQNHLGTPGGSCREVSRRNGDEATTGGRGAGGVTSRYAGVTLSLGATRSLVTALVIRCVLALKWRRCCITLYPPPQNIPSPSLLAPLPLSRRNQRHRPSPHPLCTTRGQPPAV